MVGTFVPRWAGHHGGEGGSTRGVRLGTKGSVNTVITPPARAPRLGREVWLWVAGVLVTGLGVTLIATLWVAQDAVARDRERFGRLVAGDLAALENRLQANNSVLRELAGYFDERATVNTNQWRHRLELIDPERNYSELAEIGFALEGHFLWEPLPPQDVMAHKLPGPTQGLQQPGTVYFPVVYSWRSEGWQPRPYGEGFFTDPVLNRTFPHAYNSLQPGLTPPYALGRDAQGQPVRGVTLMLATFLPEMVKAEAGWPDDIGRPANLRRGNHIGGLVFLSWRMDDLFRMVFGEELREVALEIFDGPEPVANRRWNTFPPKWLGGSADGLVRAPSAMPWRPAFTTNLLRPNYGGKVLVRASSTPWFDRQSQRGRVGLVVGAGSLLSIALTGLVFVQARGRSRAESLAAELAESRELLRRAAAERERLSRDLHDGTVQSLYAVGLGLGRARRTLGESAEGERIEHALTELDEVVAELRRFLVQLDPGVSPVQRPELALGELVTRLCRVSATELGFTTAPDFHAELPPPVVLDLLQIVRESVSNALRHGRAARVEISLQRLGDRVRLEVRDNGCGFDVATLPPNGGHGLANLRHRAEAHGGRLEVISQPGGPTVVAFEIPTHD